MATTSIPVPRPFLIMGVINVTPDSFSDGGAYLSPPDAYQRAVTYAEQGADLIDIGAESTRPGSSPVSSTEEWRRLRPVLDLLQRKQFPLAISIDTRNPETMARLLTEYPITMINDVGCRATPPVLRELAARGVSYLALHLQGEPRTMQAHPLPATHIVPVLKKFFQARIAVLQACGFAEGQIWIDPGIGFGKSDKAIMSIYTNLRELTALAATAVGVSRKSWLGRQFALPDPASRTDVSTMLELALVWQGAKLVRTHEVATLSKLRKLLQ